jgi:SAM-dependent methyltransferase
VDDYTKLTKHWLDIRYRDRPDVYMAHEPVYGLGHPGSEPNHPRRIARLYQLLRRVRQAGGRTMIDVGGAEGYFAFLCRELFGMEAVNVDISPHACRRAAEMFAIPGVAVDSVRLPFADNTFDLVTCAEVLEHLANPVPSVLELQRIAKESLVLSTEMWKARDEDRDRLLAERDGEPHGERSIFADSDIKPLLSPFEVKYERQVVPDWSLFNDDRKIDKAKLRAALVAIDQLDPHAEEGTYGIVALVRKKARTPPPKAPTRCRRTRSPR